MTRYTVQVMNDGKEVPGQVFREVPEDRVDLARTTLRSSLPDGSSRWISVTLIQTL